MATRSDQELRRRILEYLQQTEWDDRLEPLRAAGWASDAFTSDLLDLVASPNDAAELRGAADRMLASYPDVPSILLVRSVAEALCRDADMAVVSSNAQAAVTFALSTYKVDDTLVAATVAWAVRSLAHGRQKWDGADAIARGALAVGNSGRNFLRILVNSFPGPLKLHPALRLSDLLATRLTKVLDLVEVN